MRVERLLGRLNGFCGCEAKWEKSKLKAPRFLKTESIGPPDSIAELRVIHPPSTFLPNQSDHAM